MSWVREYAGDSSTRSTLDSLWQPRVIRRPRARQFDPLCASFYATAASQGWIRIHRGPKCCCELGTEVRDTE